MNRSRENMIIQKGILMTDIKAIASSLEERGFCVVPEFLSRDEIDFLLADFEASPLPDNPKDVRKGQKEAFAKMRPRMEAFAWGITGAQARVDCSRFVVGAPSTFPIGAVSPGSRRASKSRRSWRLRSWVPATCC